MINLGLEYDGHRYRFKTEPSLNKIIADEAGHVPVTKAKNEIERRIKQIWKRGYFKPVTFPAEPMEVDDDADLPKLVIIHFDAANITAVNEERPDLVKGFANTVVRWNPSELSEQFSFSCCRF